MCQESSKDTARSIKPDENKLLDVEFSQNKTNIVYKEVLHFNGYAGSTSVQFHQKFSTVTSSEAFSMMPDQYIKQSSTTITASVSF